MKPLTTTTATISLVAIIASVAGIGLAADDTVTFDDNVLAVLRKRCGGCHNPD